MSSDDLNNEETLNDIRVDEKKKSETMKEYEFTEEEKENLCKAFTLLDVDGDGVIDPEDFGQLLISWGRMPNDEELNDMKSYANGIGCEGSHGMDFESFRNYIAKQLANTNEEKELRNAFEVFDSSPPTGKINLTELRHFLKHKGLKLTDDEIDFLFKEEDYWMLEEKNFFDYEQEMMEVLQLRLQNSSLQAIRTQLRAERLTQKLIQGHSCLARKASILTLSLQHESPKYNSKLNVELQKAQSWIKRF